MPGCRHVAAERVARSDGATRHAVHQQRTTRGSDVASSTVTVTMHQRLVWTWKPVPDTAGSRDRVQPPGH